MNKNKLSILVAAVFLALSSAPVHSQSAGNVVQILMPKNAFTGDRCELKYVFRSDADLFSDKITGQQTTCLELVTDWPVFNNLSDKCLIQSATLEHIGTEYTLTLCFIPWRSGVIDFASFDLAGLVRVSQDRDSAGAVFTIDIAPVTINSIVEKTHITSLRPSLGPLVVPGTTIILIGLAALFILCAGAGLFLLLKLPVLIAYYFSTKQDRRLRKLGKKTARILRKIARNRKLDDSLFCQKLSAALREYLCIRFEDSFSVLTTGSLFRKFEEMALGSLSEAQSYAVSEMTEVFTRCDYIRFAKGSVDSRRQPPEIYETILGEGERELLVNRCIKAVEIFSGEEGGAE